jgi:DNA-binding XRE family transcriptional regulator
MLIRLDPDLTKAARLAAGHTHYSLSEASGISRQTIAKIENAQLPWGNHVWVARAIAHALGVDLEEIAAGPAVRAERPDKRKP